MKTKYLFILPMMLSLVACSTQQKPSGGGNTPSGGNNIYHGRGVPSDSLGNNYNHYYDEDSRYVYEKKDGKWINQLTYGSNALFEEPNKQSKVLAANNGINHQVLKDALMMSFYSTNVTCKMRGYQDGNDPDSGSAVNTKQDGRYIETFTNDWVHNGYLKIDEEGATWQYQGGQYVKVPELGMEMPHPTYDNLSYELMLIYDDDLGQQTSIVCGNMDKVTYDSASRFYSISNIQIHHNARTTMYFVDPIEDNMTLDFKFKVSTDQSYVTYAELKVVHSENKSYFENLVTNYEFTDLHTTVVEMPK